MKTDTRQISHLYHNDLKGQTTDLQREEHIIPLLIWIDFARICLGFGLQGIIQKLSGVEQTGWSLPWPSNLQTIDLYEAWRTEQTVIEDLWDKGFISINCNCWMKPKSYRSNALQLAFPLSYITIHYLKCTQTHFCNLSLKECQVHSRKKVHACHGHIRLHNHSRTKWPWKSLS